MFDVSDLYNVPDLWEYLKTSPLPKVLYGMGDGADKVIAVCEKYGIVLSGVFASDDFVRYQSFHGFTVKKYSELKKELGSFIILVCFASRLDNVIDRIKMLETENELYIPDVPVYGDNLFNLHFLSKNRQSIEQVYDLLCDEQSKKVYLYSLMYKLTGKTKYLFGCETPVHESYYNIIRPKKDSVYVDIGAYNGDTIREYISYAGKVRKIYGFEPDEKNFKKLSLFSAGIENTDIEIHNIAAWDKEETLVFSARGGRNSTGCISGTQRKIKEIKACPADMFVKENADYIKVDAEGAEKQVIEGMKNIISRSYPTLNIALYHRSEDMFEIPLQIRSITNNYNFYMRHFPYFPCWDTNLYAVKK